MATHTDKEESRLFLPNELKPLDVVMTAIHVTRENGSRERWVIEIKCGAPMTAEVRVEKEVS